MQNISILSKHELKQFSKHLFKKNIYKYIIISVILTFLGAFIIWMQTSVLNLISGIILAFLGISFIPILLLINNYSLNKTIEQNIKQYGEEGLVVTTILGENDLTFISEYNNKEISQTVVNYGNILTVEENEIYIFIYLSKNQALVLNKKGFINCTYEEFKNYFIKKLKENK